MPQNTPAFHSMGYFTPKYVFHVGCKILWVSMLEKKQYRIQEQIIVVSRLKTFVYLDILQTIKVVYWPAYDASKETNSSLSDTTRRKWTTVGVTMPTA